MCVRLRRCTLICTRLTRRCQFRGVRAWKLSTLSMAMPRAPSMVSSFAACGSVRGKPSRMKPVRHSGACGWREGVWSEARQWWRAFGLTVAAVLC